MSEIRIVGNSQSYQLTGEVSNLEIKLTGDFDFNADTPIVFSYEDKRFSFENRHTLFQFSEKARGTSFDQLLILFMERGIDIKDWVKNKSLENSLLKSIFLIYHWIELPITSPFELNLKSQLFNNFIVDWTNQPESQRDIYLIDEKLCIQKNKPSLEKLVELNLLVKLYVTTSNNVTFFNYFTPLIKPGVSREFFNSPIDTSSNYTYALWQEILKERNIRLAYWSKNRF